MTQYSTKEKLEKCENIHANCYASTTKAGFFWSILLKWKGSVFKLIYQDMVVFVIIYALISMFYRYGIYSNPHSRQNFEIVCFYMNGFSKLIPIAFLTGFYVSQVVNRWWDQFMTLPWPDKLALKLVNFCPGTVSTTMNTNMADLQFGVEGKLWHIFFCTVPPQD